MKNHFEIIGGIVYLDKSLYADSLKVDSNLSKLTGSCCADIFKTKPHVQCGIESVTIDFSDSDAVMIDQDPELYVRQLQETYDNRVRGHLIMDIGEGNPIDMVINLY